MPRNEPDPGEVFWQVPRLEGPEGSKSPDMIARVHWRGYLILSPLIHEAEEWIAENISNKDKNWVDHGVLVHPKIGNEVVKMAREAGFKVLVKWDET